MQAWAMLSHHSQVCSPKISAFDQFGFFNDAEHRWSNADQPFYTFSEEAKLNKSEALR
jgi:hypothetical protein